MITPKELKELKGKDKKKALVVIMDDLMDSIVKDPEVLADFVAKWSGGFHNYSLNNSILILFQKPEATLVAGYNQWKTKHGRHVKKGAKAISILAPRTFKKAEINKYTGEEVIREHVYFKPVNVFDISDTEGDPVDVGCSDMVKGKVDLTAFIEACPYPVEYHQLGLANGMTDGNKIVLSPRNTETAEAATLIHEWAHCVLGHAKKEVHELMGRADREIEAESVAYAVTTYFGLENSKALCYIGHYNAAGDLNRGRGKNVMRAAEKIIRAIEAGAE